MDAQTHSPLQNAQVVQSEYVGSPRARKRTTDAAGCFRLGVAHNFHWASAGVEGRDWPPGYRYEYVTVSYPDYLAYETQRIGKLDILLQPVRTLELRGRVLEVGTKAPVEGAKVYLKDYRDLSCVTDSRGYFRLKASPAFYQAYRASEGGGASPRPWRDWVVVARAGYGYLTFHWAAPGDPHEELPSDRMMVQSEQ